MDQVIEPEVVSPIVDTSDLALFGIGMGIIVSAIFIGGSVATGVMIGLCSTVGLGVFIWKTRQHAPKYWNWMVDNPIKTDVFISGIFFATMVAGASLGGLIAGTSAVALSTSAIPIMKYIGKVEGVEKLTFGMERIKFGGLRANQ